jgi:hypothetical protein
MEETAMARRWEEALRQAALRRFREAWGTEFDENDEHDRIALQQMVAQERRSFGGSEAPC